MSFEKLLKERYAVRNFSDRPIEKEKLNQILEAGRLAPTAVNEQPQRIYVLKSFEALCKVRNICIQDVIDTFELPENIVPVCMLDLGYPAEDSKPSPNHFSRLPLENTVVEL